MEICQAIGVAEYFLYPGIVCRSGAIEGGGDR